MKKFLVVIALVVAAGAAYLYKFEPATWQRLLGEVSHRLESSDLLPPPLRSAIDQANAHLTVEGTIEFTNQQRAANGNLPPLIVNPKLTQAAQKKLDDMFANQYFEHISPSGVGPSDLAKQVGYKYVMVGENLALGNFKDDETLVQAWMDSPGHRANILNTRYLEIGVAVGKGQFEGREVWLAVQEFGTPLSVCPQPSTSLKSEIDANQKEIDRLQQDLAQKKAELQNNNYDRQTYNQKVDAYNAEANEFNDLVRRTKSLVESYNQEISDFNKCLAG